MMKKIKIMFETEHASRNLNRIVAERKRKLEETYDIISLKEKWIPEKCIGVSEDGQSILIPQRCRLKMVYRTSIADASKF